MKSLRPGFTLSEMLTSISIVGIISIGSIFALNNGFNLSKTSETTLKSTSSQIIEAYNLYRAQNGLIPRQIGPYEIFKNSLSASSGQVYKDIQSVNELGFNASECAQDLPAKKISLSPDIDTFLPLDWESREDEASDRIIDTGNICVFNHKDKQLQLITIKRDSGEIGNARLASGSLVNPNNSEQGDNAENNDVNNYAVDSSSPSTTPPLTPPPPVGSIQVTPKFKSAFTNRFLNLSRYIITANCNGSSFVSSEVSTLTLPEDSNCSLIVSGLSSNNNKEFFAFNSPAIEIYTNSSQSVSFPVEDRYETTITLNYEAAPYTTPVSVTAGGSVDSFELSTKTLTYLLPGGDNTILIEGEDIKSETLRLNVSKPDTKSQEIKTRFSINILATLLPKLKDSVNGGSLVRKFNPYHTDAFEFGIKFIGTMISYGQRMNLEYHGKEGSRNARFVGIGLVDNQTGAIIKNKSDIVDEIQYLKINGSIYYKHGKRLYKYIDSFWTPVKINLKNEDAKLNSDDHFKFDPDGFTTDSVSPVITPGGLNINEAWLVYDRKNNGIWVNKTLDNDDVFGDHMGQFKNGYIDLAFTFNHELLTDEKGRKYISLEDDNFLSWAGYSISKIFGNKQPKACFELKLLARDRQILDAKNYVKRIYVDYVDVKEFDKKQVNAIFQRADVLLKNNATKTSADQYWRFTNGTLKLLSDEEAQQVLKQVE